MRAYIINKHFQNNRLHLTRPRLGIWGYRKIQNVLNVKELLILHLRTFALSVYIHMLCMRIVVNIY